MKEREHSQEKYPEAPMKNRPDEIMKEREEFLKRVPEDAYLPGDDLLQRNERAETGYLGVSFVPGVTLKPFYAVVNRSVEEDGKVKTKRIWKATFPTVLEAARARRDYLKKRNQAKHLEAPAKKRPRKGNVWWLQKGATTGPPKKRPKKDNVETSGALPGDEFLARSETKRSGYEGVEIDDRKSKPYYTRGE